MGCIVRTAELRSAGRARARPWVGGGMLAAETRAFFYDTGQLLLYSSDYLLLLSFQNAGGWHGFESEMGTGVSGLRPDCPGSNREPTRRPDRIQVSRRRRAEENFTVKGFSSCPHAPRSCPRSPQG